MSDRLSPRTFGCTAFVAALLIVLVVLSRHSSHVARTAGSVPMEAYVWQRAWTPAVTAAVTTNGPHFRRLMYLGAEVQFQPELHIARVAPDLSCLKAAGVPVGIALRIGAFHGKFGAGDAQTRQLCDLAQSLLDGAHQEGLSVAELQIDCDCPESRLGGYRIWAQAIRQRIAPTPLTITALPSWLKRAEFRDLAAEVDGYVLQVHSLEKPALANGSMTLCDPEAAQRAVEQAGRIGVPFRVALPTYGYTVAFDMNGKFVGIGAEAALNLQSADIQSRELRADPNAMAVLIRAWTRDRPANMVGLIWYRLPTADDVLNWRWATLESVMAGRTPTAHVLASVHRSEPGLFDVELINHGDADAPLPARVALHWDDADLLAADALGGFDRQIQANAMVLQPSRVLNGQTISPGDRRAIGWVRLSQDKEVHADVSVSQP